jgi:antitoxin (DNA-binding transcriptional repressor) of toxin-antitoxin stability system
MKTVALEKINIGTCIADAQADRIVVTRNGKPVALIVGVEGLDAEQVELGTSSAFWQLIAERRKGKTISRAELERRLQRRDSLARKKRKGVAKGAK